MITEVVIAEVKPGMEAAYIDAFRQASVALRTVTGYRRHDLRRCLEQPNRFLFTIEWDTLEAHMVGFRSSPQYQTWKGLLHPFYDPFPTVEHYDEIDLSTDLAVEGER